MFEKGVSNLAGLNGKDLNIIIVHTRWNSEIVDSLVTCTKRTLESLSVPPSQIKTHSIPGAYELPLSTALLLKQNPGCNAIISIGCLIKGDTMHFEYIAEAVSHGLMRVGLDSGIPVIFGVLTCLNMRQALVRAGITPDGGLKEGEKIHNHGQDWANAAVEMALLAKK